MLRAGRVASITRESKLEEQVGEYDVVLFWKTARRLESMRRRDLPDGTCAGHQGAGIMHLRPHFSSTQQACDLRPDPEICECAGPGDDAIKARFGDQRKCRVFVVAGSHTVRLWNACKRFES